MRRLVIGALLAALVPTAAAQTGSPHECSFCHVTHSAPGPSLGVQAEVNSICLTCHGPAGSSSLEASVHTNDAGDFIIDCIDCHSPHNSDPNWLGGTNIKQVGRILDDDPWAKIDTPNSGLRDVVFESRGTTAVPPGPSLHSFADDDEDGNGIWDGVCQVCHTGTSHHPNDGPDPLPKHHVGKDCTECHGHDGGFRATGGSCLDCHATAQDNGDSVPLGGRRAVVGEFGLRSHHVSGAVTDADCEVCHDQSAHQGGTVYINRVDSPGSSIAIDGNPMTDPGEADKLTTTCLECHDADGANGSAPFSDGLMPPVIDDSLWNSGSHRTQMSCFGDGIFGCHSSGHGSEKNKLLAPYGVAPDPTTLAEEEEGFCLNCHDADGPSTLDLKTAFDQPINWVDEPTGLNNLATLNDRHDVQHAAQAISGAKIECTDCHDPHYLTNAQPYITDPDPNDGHVPGTDWYFYQATGDVWSETCLDCHDGSFPAGVQDHTSPITNIQATWGTDGMGGRDGSSGAGLMPGTIWEADASAGIPHTLECWRCHSPHPVYDTSYGNMNLFSLIDTMFDKDFATPLPGIISKKGDLSFDYDWSLNGSGASHLYDGGTGCNTCHERSSMLGKDNCYTCHRHGDGGRF